MREWNLALRRGRARRGIGVQGGSGSGAAAAAKVGGGVYGREESTHTYLVKVYLRLCWRTTIIRSRSLDMRDICNANLESDINKIFFVDVCEN